LKKDSSFALAYAGVADASLIMYRETKDSSWSAKALGAAQQARALSEDQPEIHLALGSVYRASGRTAEAIVELKRALELAPNNLGAVLVQSGKFREAVEPLQKSLQFSAGGQAYSNFGIAYFYLKDYEKAISAYEKAVQLVPTSDMFAGNLAETYYLVGQKDRAQVTFEQAISLAYKELQVNPRDAITKGRLGLWYGKKGDVQQAIKFIAEARALDPNNVDLIYYQAQVFALGNDNASALVALRDAFKKGQPPAIAQAEPDLQTLQRDPDFQKLVKEFAQPN
jgi:tetratricopeptide (TPR) repeat protein